VLLSLSVFCITYIHLPVTAFHVYDCCAFFKLDRSFLSPPSPNRASEPAPQSTSTSNRSTPPCLPNSWSCAITSSCLVSFSHPFRFSSMCENNRVGDRDLFLPPHFPHKDLNSVAPGLKLFPLHGLFHLHVHLVEDFPTLLLSSYSKPLWSHRLSIDFPLTKLLVYILFLFLFGKPEPPRILYFPPLAVSDV